MEKERCAFCGAMNRADAEWCGQCHRRFPPLEVSVPEIESPSDILLGQDAEQIDELEKQFEAPSSTSTRTEEVQTAGGSQQQSYKVGGRGAFTVTESGVTWKCASCDTVNPLDAQVCTVCGTSFADTVRPKVERPQKDPNLAALISLFLPGAGHVYVGQWSQGLARAVISVWVGAVVILALVAGGSGNARTVAVTFGFVATALWLLAAHDAYREARGESTLTILKGKMFVALVLGLLMLLFFLLLGAGLSARSG